MPLPSAEEELAVFALLCMVAMRTGAAGDVDLLDMDAAARGLQVLAERDDVTELLARGLASSMPAVWERHAPPEIAFQEAWVDVLRTEQRELGEALAFATATVNYWQLKPTR